MKHTLMAGIAAVTLSIGGVATAQTQPPAANTATPPATTLPSTTAPQPHLRTPADQTTGTVAPGAVSASGGMSEERAKDLIGTNLIGTDDRRAGEIDNMLVDGSGQVRAAIVEWGGFLGLGQKKAVVPIDSIRLGAGENDRARLSLSREQLEQLPAYESDKLAEYQTRFGWQNLRAVR